MQGPGLADLMPNATIRGLLCWALAWVRSLRLVPTSEDRLRAATLDERLATGGAYLNSRMSDAAEAYRSSLRWLLHRAAW